MKKILVVMSTLYNGGAERSLVNFLNELPQDKYEIDLLLFKREGMFMKQLPSYVKVLDTPKELKQLYGSVKKAGALMPVNMSFRHKDRIYISATGSCFGTMKKEDFAGNIFMDRESLI